MSCPQFVIWAPFTTDCVIKAQATGDSTAYNATVAITHNGTPATPMRHHELSPGPASRPFPLGDAFIFDPSIVLFRDVTEAVTLELWIEDLDGNVVQVDAPGGGKRPAKCSWSISKVKLSPLFVEVITG